MEAYMRNLIKRFYDLIIKLVSVKGLFAIASFITFAIKPAEYSFYAAVIFCSLLVVGREYGKLLEVLKVIKGR
jgi:TM2 domain-containing membrane protein YozV